MIGAIAMLLWPAFEAFIVVRKKLDEKIKKILGKRLDALFMTIGDEGFIILSREIYGLFKNSAKN